VFIVEDIERVAKVAQVSEASQTVVEFAFLNVPFYVEGYVDLSKIGDKTLRFIEEVYVYDRYTPYADTEYRLEELYPSTTIRLTNKLVYGYRLILYTLGGTVEVPLEVYQIKLREYVRPGAVPRTPTAELLRAVQVLGAMA